MAKKAKKGNPWVSSTAPTYAPTAPAKTSEQQFLSASSDRRSNLSKIQDALLILNWALVPPSGSFRYGSDPVRYLRGLAMGQRRLIATSEELKLDPATGELQIAFNARPIAADVGEWGVHFWNFTTGGRNRGPVNRLDSASLVAAIHGRGKKTFEKIISETIAEIR